MLHDVVIIPESTIHAGHGFQRIALALRKGPSKTTSAMAALASRRCDFASGSAAAWMIDKRMDTEKLQILFENLSSSIRKGISIVIFQRYFYTFTLW